MFVITYIDPRDGLRHREVSSGERWDREERLRKEPLPREFRDIEIVPVSAAEHFPLSNMGERR